MFRGFLLPSLTKWMPTWAALGLSSLAFGLCHLSLRDLPVLTALGMLLGSTYVRRCVNLTVSSELVVFIK